MVRYGACCFAWFVGVLAGACLAEVPSRHDEVSVSYNAQLKKYELVAGDMRASARKVTAASGRTSGFGEPDFAAVLEEDVVVQAPKWKAKVQRVEMTPSLARLLPGTADEITVEVGIFTAKASRADVRRDSGQVMLSGPVTIDGKGFNLTANSAIFNLEFSGVLLFGGKKPVRIKLGDKKAIEAHSVKFDLRTKQISQTKD